MFDKLQNIYITDALIEMIAIIQFNECNNKNWLMQTNYVKSMWLKGAEKSLNDFNDMIDIFRQNSINFK